MGIPDLKFINRKIPIIDVARALGLEVGANNVHCWRRELHHNGDRTASVGIRAANNTLKCFGCDIGPLGPADLVMEVLEMKNPGEAARWIAQRFNVPELPAGKNLVQPDRRIYQYGHESDIGVLVRSGLWARLSQAARAIVPVLLELAERDPATQTLRIKISYLGLARYGGVSSPNAIAGALRELQEIDWLSKSAADTATYLLTPRSDKLLELAHSNCAQTRDEIEIERRLRAEIRAKRKRTAY